MPSKSRRPPMPLLALVLSLALAGCTSRAPEWRELGISLAEPVPEGLAFTWDHVGEADGYRLRFVHMTGAVVCSLDVAQARKPAYLLSRDSLPAGLAHGWQMTLEIQALRRGQPWPVSGMRPFKVP